LNSNSAHIQVFEFDKIRVGHVYGKTEFTESMYHALIHQCANKPSPYFTILHNGIQFNQFVGVIQVGRILYEVLPKADRISQDSTDTDEKKRWQKILIGMMRAVHGFDVKSTGESQLKVRRNSILDLYIEIFIKETEKLLRQGLVKKYRKKEENSFALKGQLMIARHIQQNSVHQERFFVRHSVYNTEHILNQILYETLQVIHRINTETTLESKIGSLLLNFPEMPAIKITEKTFSKIILDRKTNGYKRALDIAKLILLNFHPDITKGSQHAITLMFDMNKLWEAFVGVSLKKHAKDGWQIKLQNKTKFWESHDCGDVNIKPDITISKDKISIALDTKWKNLNNSAPSADDLRQMYVYSIYFKAVKSGLIYPGDSSRAILGKFVPVSSTGAMPEGCFLQMITTSENILIWQNDIYKTILAHCG
jgi:5-methylcytosine-specific restriction enzyme subunit McrC